jgi:hypothetical protein
VQALHAGIEAARTFLPSSVEHPHLVLCAVDSEQRLLAAADRLFRRSIRHIIFREPDRANEATALATEPLPAWRRGILAPYRCLNEVDFLNPANRAQEPGGPAAVGPEGGVS